MKYSSIRTHLQPFSIYAKRSTTINHAFASAIAPQDEYDAALIAEAVRNLGQDPNAELVCVYCDDRPADTWDHVTGLVKDKRYAGHGHTLANLLPCCSRCNSQKGGKDWHDFLASTIPDEAKRAAKIAHLEGYLARYGREAFGHEDITRLLPEEMRELAAIQARILELMREADAVAGVIRAGVKQHLRAQQEPTGVAK
jgi:hypothetical protein